MFDWFWKGVFGIPPSAKLTKEDKRTIRELVIETYLGDAKTPNMSIPGPLATMAGTAFAVFGGAEALIKGLNVINPRIKKIKELSDWRDPQSTPTRRDPLVLDLNRDGKVELKNAAYFDLNANGFHEFTRWIDKTDAFLVLDKNFNGKADDGGELFGDAMTLPDGSLALTGFDALKAYDSNGDGKIDASDEIYASLKVLTGEGKMSSLADAGVKSLNVSSEAVNESTPPALSQSDLANRSAA